MAKKIIFTFFFSLMLCSVNAQGWNHRSFDPVKFRNAMIQFVVDANHLTPAEKKAFVPVFEELLIKRQELFNELRKYRHLENASEKEYLDAVQQLDRIAVELKVVQQTYHKKLLKVLPARRVYQLMKAENEFNQRSIQRMTGGRRR